MMVNFHLSYTLITRVLPMHIQIKPELPQWGSVNFVQIKTQIDLQIYMDFMKI